MNKLLTWRGDSPMRELEQRWLAAPLSRMECVTLLARLAMNTGSEAHVYSVRKLAETMEKAEQIRQEHREDMPNEVEDLYQRLTDNYLALMEAIPQVFSVRLLAELEQAQGAPGDVSLASKVRAWLGE